MSPFASAGDSKSGAALNVNTPEVDPIETTPASSPLKLNVNESPSESVADTVPMLVLPSVTENVFPLVINGALLPPPAPPELEPPLPPPQAETKTNVKNATESFFILNP